MAAPLPTQLCVCLSERRRLGAWRGVGEGGINARFRALGFAQLEVKQAARGPDNGRRWAARVDLMVSRELSAIPDRCAHHVCKPSAGDISEHTAYVHRTQPSKVRVQPTPLFR